MRLMLNYSKTEVKLDSSLIVTTTWWTKERTQQNGWSAEHNDFAGHITLVLFKRRNKLLLRTKHTAFAYDFKQDLDGKI